MLKQIFGSAASVILTGRPPSAGPVPWRDLLKKNSTTSAFKPPSSIKSQRPTSTQEHVTFASDSTLAASPAPSGAAKNESHLPHSSSSTSVLPSDLPNENCAPVLLLPNGGIPWVERSYLAQRQTVKVLGTQNKGNNLLGPG